MGEKKDKGGKVSFASAMPREEAISYFESIVSGLKRGAVHLKQEEETIILNPSPQIDVEVKAVSKREKEKISFKMSWRNPSGSELDISSEGQGQQ